MRLAAALAILLVGACAAGGGYRLVPGESTAHDVEMVLGRPAVTRKGPDGETVYWYPQLPYGRANYAARIDEDGTLLAYEQRLTEENIKKVTIGWPAGQVFDLLGPPYHPEAYPRMERVAWTYPMLIQGYGYPKWFVVYLSMRDNTVVETYLMDDPTIQRRGFFRW